MYSGTKSTVNKAINQMASIRPDSCYRLRTEPQDSCSDLQTGHVVLLSRESGQRGRMQSASGSDGGP
jgi:hypothetical protein